MAKRKSKFKPLDHGFKPSAYQLKVFEFIADRTAGSAIIDAKAGSGKTTTIIEALKYIPATEKVVFLAFNKSIAEALKAKVPANVEALTLNAIGYRAWRMSMPGVRHIVDAKKVDGILRQMKEEAAAAYAGTLQQESGDRLKILTKEFYTLKSMVTKAKVVGVNPTGVVGATCGLLPDSPEIWAEIMDAYSIECEDALNEKAVVRLASAALTRCAREKLTIDFDDMFYLPLIYGVRFPVYDWVFVDEAQDVSNIQREILTYIVKPGGRLIAVGDPHQSIYGFRGANPDSLRLIQAEFDAKVLPLNVCYRCGKTIIAAAQRLVPEIEAHENAPEGSIHSLGDKWRAQDFLPTDFILCRNTAPLVSLAYRLLREGVPCHIKGREIGSGLVTLIKKMDCTKVSTLFERLREWEIKECARLRAKDPDANTESVSDRVESITAVAESLQTDSVQALIEALQAMFRIGRDEDVSGLLTLSTIHKAKGLEAERVFILNSYLMPSRHAKKDWEMQQEAHIEYVAITRAKQELYYIETERLSRRPQ